MTRLANLLGFATGNGSRPGSGRDASAPRRDAPLSRKTDLRYMSHFYRAARERGMRDASLGLPMDEAEALAPGYRSGYEELSAPAVRPLSIDLESPHLLANDIVPVKRYLAAAREIRARSAPLWAAALSSSGWERRPSRVEVSHIHPGHVLPDAGAVFPTVKAAIDGLVDAGGVPDDSPDWITALTLRAPRLAARPPLVRITVLRDLPAA